MNILVTGANGQLGNEMRIISKDSTDKYIFTDVNQVEGLETTYLDITDLDAIRMIVAENNVNAIVNCAAWTNVDGAEDPEKFSLVERLNAIAPENLAKAMKEVYGMDPMPYRGGGSITVIATAQKVLKATPTLLGFGLERDLIHSPNESYLLKQFYRGIETIVGFYKYY